MTGPEHYAEAEEPLAPVPQAHRAALAGIRWPDLPERNLA